MVEDKIHGRGSFGRTANTGAPDEKKESFGKKIGGALRDMRSFLTKPKEKSGKPLGSLKSVPEIKKPAAPLPIVFNVQKLNLKTVNQALMLVLIGLASLMFYVTFRTRPDISSVMAVVSRIKFPETAPKKITTFKELPFYLDQVKSRDVFSVFQEKKEVVPAVETVKEEPPPPPKISIEEKAKNLKLIGISWGNDPKAIIRNTGDQSMYFVAEGETIKGTDITVDTILKEEVIISSEGESMSML